MTGIVPTPASGGLPVRDANGNTIPQPSVQNSYNPPAGFTVSCTLNYLPTDCTARITAAQINAFQAEMLCLAVALDPDGTWNCNSTCNLSTAFMNWVADTLPDAVADAICNIDAGSIADLSTASFIMCGPDGAVRVSFGDVFTPETIGEALCAADEAVPNLATRLIGCDGAGTAIKIDPVALTPIIADAICANDEAGDTLAACLISTDTNNELVQGTDGRLSVPTPAVAAACAVPAFLRGEDASGTDLLFAWDGLKASHLFTATGASASVPLDVAGQSTVAQSATVTLTNPNPCNPMTFYILRVTAYSPDLLDNGNVVLQHVFVRDGADSGSYTISRLRENAPAGYRTAETADYIRPTILTLAPNASTDVSLRLDLNVVIPYGAGSFAPVSGNLLILGIVT